jgi:hypothetical protein
MRMEELKSGIYLEYFSTTSLRFSAGIRRFMRRNLTIFFSEEKELAKHDIKNAWSFKFEINYRF